MRKTRLFPYIILAGFILLVCKLPPSATESTRRFCIGSFSPIWELCHLFSHRAHPTKELHNQIHALTQENHKLQLQLDSIKEWLFHEDRIEELMHKWHRLHKVASDGASSFYQRRSDLLCSILQLHMQAIPAKVIYREPTLWSSIIWVNVGEKDNSFLQKKVIAKNSLVVVGDILVGVVEEVGKTKSKIRLLTDTKCIPSVRAIRGKVQNDFFAEQIDHFMHILQTKEELFASEQEKADLYRHLHQIQERLRQPSQELYLAKGELYGGSLPLWKSRGQFLQGVGFNYDFSDVESPARDLRTGKVSSNPHSEPVRLLREGDLLVTTGLDGVFPPDLKVAVVATVEKLQEGSSHYTLTARPLIANFQELQTVFILPPIIEAD